MTVMRIAGLALVAVVALGTSAPAQRPVPPSQPDSGPGGREYPHAQVTKTTLGSGAEEVTIFEPSDPTPARAPVVVFSHGWGGMNPDYYGAWITHIVRRGYTVPWAGCSARTSPCARCADSSRRRSP
jgi:hypothetical protein